MTLGETEDSPPQEIVSFMSVGVGLEGQINLPPLSGPIADNYAKEYNVCDLIG